MKEIQGLRLIKPRPTPRLPPVEDVNNSEVMLGAVVWAIVIAVCILVIVFAVRH